MLFKKKESRNLANSFDESFVFETILDEFTSVYSIDFGKRTLTAYKQDALSKKRFSMFAEGSVSYDEAVNYYIESEVFPEDKNIVREAFDLNLVKNELKNHKVKTNQFRVSYKGNTYYVETKFIKVQSDENKAVFIFRNITDEVLKSQTIQQEIYENERIIEMLASEYESIYRVNFTQHTFEYIRYPAYLENFKAAFDSGKNAISTYEKYVKNYVYADDVEKMMALANPSYIREVLRNKNSFVVTFRDISKGSVQNLELKIFRMFSGKDFVIIAGFVNRDAERFLESESKEINIKDKICCLGRDYDCIASVNFENNSAQIVSCTKKFMSYCRNSENEITDYQALLNRLSQIFVLESDREYYFEKMAKEEVYKGLQDNVVYYVTYRVKIDDKEYPYQAKFVYDSEDKAKVIVGFHKIV